jgi:hypothetical protein
VKQFQYEADPARFIAATRKSERKLHAPKWPKGKWPRAPIGDDKKCSRCGVVKPIAEFKLQKNGRPAWCKECTRADIRAHYQRNKDRILQRQRAVFAGLGPEQRAALLEKWRAAQATPESKERAKKRALLHKNDPAWIERKKLIAHRCHLRRKEKVRAYNQLPEVRARRRMLAKLRPRTENQRATARVHAKLQRVMKRGTKVSAAQKLTRKDWDLLCARVEGKCVYCDTGAKLTFDHIFPVSQGGTNHRDNFVPACFACNVQRKAQSFFDFAISKGRDPLEILWKVRGIAPCLSP